MVSIRARTTIIAYNDSHLNLKLASGMCLWGKQLSESRTLAKRHCVLQNRTSQAKTTFCYLHYAQILAYLTSTCQRDLIVLLAAVLIQFS